MLVLAHVQCPTFHCTANLRFIWKEKRYINWIVKIETFVVFDLERVPVIFFFLPLFKLRQRVERYFLLALGSLYDGCYELFEERQFQ